MASNNNYFSFTPVATQHYSLSTTPYAPAAYVQPAQGAATYMAAPTAPIFEAYPSQHATAQYATYGVRTQVIAPMATPSYDAGKTYYTPIAAVAPQQTATVYTLPTNATYQINSYQPFYDSSKKYYPMAPQPAPSTMYTVAAEPVYQTLAVANSKPLYVSGTYPSMVQHPRQMMPDKTDTGQYAPSPAYPYQAFANPGSAARSDTPQPQKYQYHQVSSNLVAIRSELVSKPSSSTNNHQPNISVLPTSRAMVTTQKTTPGKESDHYGTVTSSNFYSNFTKTSTATASSCGTFATSPQMKWYQKPASTSLSTTSLHNQYQSRTSKLYYCDTCKVNCAGALTYKEHLEGKVHKRKESFAKVNSTFASTTSSTSTSVSMTTSSQLHCKLCEVECGTADAYAIHVRGPKHQKVLKTHHSLGRLHPDGNSRQGGQTPFTSSSKSDTTITYKPQGDAQENLNTDDHDKDVQPVGTEYIEESRNETGTAVSFYCKLCDCKFTDPNAKIMHLKGRRHRLQYKKKVDPSLVVDIKPTKYGFESFRRHVEDKFRLEREQRLYEEEMMDSQHHPWPPVPFNPFFASMPPMRRPVMDSFNDRHIMAKHSSIYPHENELQAIQVTVSCIEKALKLVSEDINESLKEMDVTPKQELKGVQRVGPLAKGLLLRGELKVELVVLFSDRPTVSLLDSVSQSFSKHIQTVTDDSFEVNQNITEAGLLIVRNVEPKITCVVTLTSPVIREQLLSSTDSLANPDPSDSLDQRRCLNALAELRHAKWFQAKISGVQSYLIVLRILKDICNRIPCWASMGTWSLELLVEKCCFVGSGFPPAPGIPPLPGLPPGPGIPQGPGLPPGDALRRIFECIASGIILPGGPGLYDPCEKDPTDALSELDVQMKEEITASAQQAVRLIAFHQIHKMLGMQQLSGGPVAFFPDGMQLLGGTPVVSGNGNGPMKRSLTDTEEDGNRKKDRKDVL